MINSKATVNNTQLTMDNIEAYCRERGARLTQQRRETIAVLQLAGKPLTAYELLARLETLQSRKLAPLTVYRSLDFWVDQGLVHKITSSHSYVICNHPEKHNHESMHLICTECGAGQELSMPEVMTALDQTAADSNFTIKQRIVEIQGLCGKCTS